MIKNFSLILIFVELMFFIFCKNLTNPLKRSTKQ